MELREWLIILGLALVSLIVVDGVRRLQRQRRVPRLDQSVDNLPRASMEELDSEAREAEINWELPNGGARVVKPADYSGLGEKPRLERQEHPGPSRVLSDFKRSFSRAATRAQGPVGGQRFAYEGNAGDEHADTRPTPAETGFKSAAVRSTEKVRPSNVTPEPEAVPEKVKATPEHVSFEPPAFEAPAFDTPAKASAAVESAEVPMTASFQQPFERREPSLFAEPELATSPGRVEPEEPTLSTAPASPSAYRADTARPDATQEQAPLSEPTEDAQPLRADASPSVEVTAESDATVEEPVLRADPADAAAHTNVSESRQRRQLRSNTAGELDDDAVDAYRLVDFEGMGRSFKRRMIEHRQARARKKAERAERAKALARQKAERKALEAEQRREAREAAEAEKARIAQENARVREREAAQSATRREEDELYRAEPSMTALRGQALRDEHVDESDDSAFEDSYETPDESVVRPHPTLEKVLRHDVSGARPKEALSDASEIIVISVLSREEGGFDGGRLLELMMACGLRYCRGMGVFHRFETESDDSELQFSMVNVVKPGTFPIEQMDEFVTPGITLLMPLPGALDASSAFEAMVETAMVVVRHMGGELKDENHSVMTAQTIEFARQRVHEFERRYRLQRRAR